jgi:hypothetical protein
MKTIILALCILTFALFVETAGNPLAGLPSAAGSTIAQIQALGDNAWLDLGTPVADPAWGTARGPGRRRRRAP